MWHYASHATGSCLTDEGCAQWMKCTCNAQTHTANVWVNKYHVQTCKTNVHVNALAMNTHVT